MTGRKFLCVWLIAWTASMASADDFPAVYNSERDVQAHPLPAHEAAARMQVPDGFQVSVFAAEPEVQNPIAMAWDDAGRMWVAENFTYAERQQRFDLSLRDRVLVFTDADGDGRADSRTVFTDNVQMLTSVEVGRGGVWLMCPPQLLFIPDADGDAVADGRARVVLDGFTVAQDNYHNFANGLRWGPDGWLYGRCGHSCPGRLGIPGTPDEQRVPIDGGLWRFHPEQNIVEVLCHGTVNPWGHDWDARGELFFINTVIGHLWHLLPGAHMKESFGESMNPLVYQRLDTIADHYHFDTTGSWTESRDGNANDHGGGHAHIGMMIYQGQRWPSQYHGQLFTLNMHGRRANVERLERHKSGYVGRHEPDFFLADDPFFRGIDMQTGPDGNAFVLDWSDTGECHDHTGVHRSSGRIYKISYNPAAPPDEHAATAASPGSDNPSGTVDSAASACRPQIFKPACLGGQGRLPQLWQQYQAGQTTPKMLRKLLHDDDEYVRVWAIRLLTDLWPLDTIMGPLPSANYPHDQKALEQFMHMARYDRSGPVLLTLASTLQRLPVRVRPVVAAGLMQRADFRHDETLAHMIWFGVMPLADESPQLLQSLASSCRFPLVLQSIARTLAARMDDHPDVVDQLLEAAVQQMPELQLAVLHGFHDALRGRRKAARPSAWDLFSSQPAVSSEQDVVRALNVIFGDGQALEELRAIALDEQAAIATRTAALQSLIAARPPDLRQICESLLTVRILNTVAARGLATFDDAEIATRLLQNYRRFQPEDRPALLDLLTSRPRFAHALLDHMAGPSPLIPPAELTAVHARQIRLLQNEVLDQRLAEVWGTLRDSSADKQQALQLMRAEMTDDQLHHADLPAGRLLFRRLCAQCHQLYDDGAPIGPNLTGSQRASLDYLLENILDPGAVVGRDYRMSIVVLNDGRTLNGLIASRDSQTFVLQTATERHTIRNEDVEEVHETSLSPMPDGLLSNLTSEQRNSLFAYLMHPQQVALPQE